MEGSEDALTVDKNVVSIEDAMKSIRGCKAIFIITDLNDNVDIKGYIFYISRSEDTYSELIEKYQGLTEKAMLIGSYESGGSVGVQYKV